MNFLARVLWRAAKYAGAHPRDPLIAEWFGGSRTASGVNVTPESAMEVPAVYAAVKLVAETVASLPLIVYRKLADGKERDPAHPLYELLHDQPNRWQTSSEWLEMMLVDSILRGCSYSRKVATGRQAITELIPLNARRVRPVLVDPQGRVLQEMAPGARLVYSYTPPSGPAEVLLANEVLRIPGMLNHGLIAQSPIDLHKETVGLSVIAQAYGARFFENDARPGGGVKIPGTFKDDEAIKRFRRKWQEAYGGENKHSVAVFEGGAEWVDIGMTNQDAQFLETRKHQVADIARIMSRVPLHMIGELDRATFSNIEQQSIEFVRYTLRPWLKRIEQSIRRDLFDVADWRRTHAVEFLTDALLSGETLARFRAYSIARQWGWMSANDVRRKENENPIEGGDLYLTPMNMGDATNVADIDDDPPAKPNGKGNGDARSLQ